MKIEEFKRLIESDLYNGMPIIFVKPSNCPFLVHQYIKQIRKDNHLEVQYVEKIQEIPTANFFETSPTQIFYICTESSIEDLTELSALENCAFLIEKVTEQYDRADAYVVEIPKLQSWQIKDFISSQLPILSADEVEAMIKDTAGDLFAIEKEIDKLTIFNSEEQKTITSLTHHEAGVSYENIFDLINVILRKDKKHIQEIYKAIDTKNLSSIGLTTLLCNNFRNLIKVQLSPNPTMVNTGLKSSQIWAIKKSLGGIYSKEGLIKLFKLLTTIERQIKEGRLPASISIDYVLTEVFKA